MQRQKHIPTSVYLLADHLDAALAACEDLLRLTRQTAEPARLRTCLRRLDLTATMHLLQARQNTKELRRADRRLASEAAHFLAATASLPKAAEEIGSPSAGYLDEGCDGSAGNTDGSANLLVTNQFQIGRRIPVGTVSDLTAAMLDALERYYVLYEDAEPDAMLHCSPFAASVATQTSPS